MNKLFSKNYTIRFIIAHHLVTCKYLFNEITTFCNEKNLILKQLNITDSVERHPNGPTIVKTSFVTICGRKKDFELLKDFLSQLEKNKFILILTV